MSVLPVHDASTRAERLCWGASIAASAVLLGLLAIRVATFPDLWSWWTPLALIGGAAAADFGSALVHWGADTWGRDDLPIIGRRLLVPFRVHHVNPDDLILRRFLDANGDVALLYIPALLSFLAVPAETTWGGPVSIFGFAFCGVGVMTNQIHQWAHMPSPPRPIRALQRCRLILSPEAHAAHHGRPYDAQYAITTGWCNRPLEAIGFFRRLEVVITRVTGLQPRSADRNYEQRHLQM